MKESIYKYCILVLDFGSQYTQLIARRIREIGVYCELRRWDITETQIRKLNPNGIILSGSPESVTRDNSPRVSKYVFESGIPVLGICYGMQVMVVQLGGVVERSQKREFGHTKLEIEKNSILLHGLKGPFVLKNKNLLNVWMSHNDKIITIPTDFVTIASTKTCPFAIIANEEKRFYGVQFHPEVTHSKNGSRILKHFVYDICQCKKFWRSKRIINNVIDYIRQRVSNGKVILGFSGGIDSSVTAMLLHRAIGRNLTCIFVDNGLLRLGEKQSVMDISDRFGLNIIYVSAEERFFTELKHVEDPETKRKIIGRLFVKIFEEEALKINGAKWLAQGTIYSDVIESAASSIHDAHVIKSHHNVGGFPDKTNMNLIEPLRNLFKDEVRRIGLKMGIPRSVLYRHPFPGPGLSVRILGEVKKEYCNLLRMVDAIFLEELQKAKLYKKVSQAFAVFLPIRSVGVMGDTRKYGWVVSLRAVETIDFMTARCARLPFNFLMHISNRITNEVNGISRVVYDISGKPPATIEWE